MIKWKSFTTTDYIELVERASQPIYPNPCIDRFSLLYNSPESKIINIKIYDILGKEQLSARLEVEEGDNLLPISVKNLSSGIYFVKIDNTNICEKLIIE